MFFEIKPEQIEKLSSTELVQLMKALLLAECRATNVPLRAAHVPLQITVADGGEDGRMEWSEGAAHTAYLPCRFNVLQSKAQKLSASVVRNEVLKTPRVKDGKKAQVVAPILNGAIRDALDNTGSYIIFCNQPMVGNKRDTLVKAIKSAIVDGGGDPKKLAALEVYDANVVADWVNSHPPVALSVASQQLGRPLHGFRTHQDWGASPEIANVPWQDDGKPRFALAKPPPSSTSESGPPGWTASQTILAIREHVTKGGSIVRVAGPSGYGKSRFLYEVFVNTSQEIADLIDTGDVLYVDGSLSAEHVVNLTLEMAQANSSAILVVDECDDQLHLKLSQIVQRVGSRLKLFTIDTETKITVGKSLLYIQIEKSDDELIQLIAKGVNPGLDAGDTAFIAGLATGFPRMAVLAAEQGADRRQAIQSIEQVVERIVWNSREKNAEAQRVLEIACLFDWFGLEGRVKDQAEWMARRVASMSEAAFAEHLRLFIPRGIINKRGDFLQIGPIPLAARLGVQRLKAMSCEQLVELYTTAPPPLQASLLRRMKWLDMSPTAVAFAEALLGQNGIGNLAALSTGFGSECLHRLLHVNPDAAAATIERVFGSLSLDELAVLESARRHLVWCLEALVFKQSSFDRAATLLRRLAAVETERYSNNATGRFTELFHLYLSGTEAAPQDRLLVLDDGLNSKDIRERRVCVEALRKMMETNHFSRFGGSEQIGSASPSSDWQPSTQKEIWEFYRSAIGRLLEICKAEHELALRAQNILGNATRGLLNVLPYDDIAKFVRDLVAFDAGRMQAIFGISSWLYFDASAAGSEMTVKVRALYYEVLPTDILKLLRVYTTGWQSDLHDPDRSYSERDDNHDFEYSIRQSKLIAKDMIADENLCCEALRTLACSQDHTTAPFAEYLIVNCENPGQLFASAVQFVEEVKSPPNISLFQGLVTGATRRSRELARDFVSIALKSGQLKEHAISFIYASGIGPDEIALVVELLRSGDLTPAQTVFLSYGQRLSGLSDTELMPLFEELERLGPNGIWAIFGIMAMLLFRGKHPSRIQSQLIKRIVVDPSLTEVKGSNIDGHHFEDIVQTLIASRPPGKQFTTNLVRNLLRICRAGANEVFRWLDGPVQKILSNLSKYYPDIVWNEIAKKIENRSRLVRHYGERLLSGAHKVDHLGRGIDVDIDPSTYIDWVRKRPEARAYRAVDWLPIAFKGADGKLRWHPELLAYVDEFVDHSGVLNAVRERLVPSFYSNSLVPHLEGALELMESWRSHKVPSVRAFAASTKASLRQQIAAERKRDEEDLIRFG